MTGGDCRKNIVLVIATKETDLDVGTGHQIYKLLHSLIEREKACISKETMEASLQPWNQSYIFTALLTSLAHDSKKTTERSIFGMPFHCTMSYLTEQLTLISSRSLVADHTGISFLGKTGFSELIISESFEDDTKVNGCACMCSNGDFWEVNMLNSYFVKSLQSSLYKIL